MSRLRYCQRLLICLALAPWLGFVAAPSIAADDPPGVEAADTEAGEALNEAVEHAEGDHAAVDHHDHGPASNHPLSIDPDLALVTLIVFVLLLLVLTKFAWKPIMAGLAKRESAIADDIDSAAARRKEAELLLADYQLQLEKASGEVRAMLDGAKKEAEVMKQSILEEASKAAAAEKDRATREIEAAKNSAITEIAEHSVNIAFRVASDAVRREVKPDDHRNLIEDALKQFSNKN